MRFWLFSFLEKRRLAQRKEDIEIKLLLSSERMEPLPQDVADALVGELRDIERRLNT